MHQPLRSIWLLLLGAFFFCANAAVGQVAVTPGNLTYTQNFGTLAQTGTTNAWADNTTLPGWYSNRTVYLAGTGSNNAGGLYSFGAASNAERALGSVGSGSAEPVYGVVFTNNTGVAITSVQVGYTGEQWRNGGNTAAQQLTFAYATGSSLVLASTATNVAALNFVSPITGATAATLDGNSAANRTVIPATQITFPTAVANGEQILLRWTDINDGGNDHGLAIDDLSVTFTTAGTPTGPSLSASPTALSGFATTQGTVSAPQSYTLTAQQLTAGITVTAPANVAVSSDNITYAGVLNLAQTTTSATVFVRLTGVAQGAVSGSITNVSGAQTASVSISGNVGPVPGTFAKISAIQGAGNTAALTGTQAIEGIVTRTFPGSAGQNGFYVQEEDADQDGNRATSEGIFCFDPAGTYASLTVGTKVQVTGGVAEFTSSSDGVNSSVTQLANLTGVVNLGAGTLPTATPVSLPFAAPVGGVSALERFEGMLVTVSGANGPLTVTEHFGLAQYGQVTLSAGDGTNQAGTDGRIEQYTQFNAPSVSGYSAYVAATARRKLILDDASSVTYPATIIHARGGNPLSASNTLRGGDTVGSITGILDDRFDGYRLQTNTGVNFAATNPRPATIPAVGGTLKAGFANVLNYFTTFGGSANRGADNAAEFDRQRVKIIANLIGTGADIIGLSEIQNNGYGATSAIQNLVNGLNASAGAGTYAFVTPNASTGSDAITTAILYKPASVSLVGPAVPIPASFGTGSYGVVGRSSIAQTFEQLAGGGVFTMVANHWKSKGSASAGSGNADIGDGQALSNGIRVRQAQDILQWIGTNPTGTTDPDYLIVGDLNAYALEDPITTLTSAGYSALIPTTSYSFAFMGEWGSLDHALANGSLQTQVAGAAKWFINSDEPTALDYNTENKTAAQQTSLFSADQYRSADHDPLVVGLNLSKSLPVRLASFGATIVGDQVSLGWETASEQNASHFVVERSRDAREFGAVGRVSATGDSPTRVSYGLLDALPLPGTSYYRLRLVDRDGETEYSKIVAVTLDGMTPAMALLGNPTVGTTLRLAVRNMDGATYQLRSLTGQAIRLRTLQQTDRSVTLLVDQGIAAGVYLLEGKTETTRTVVKVLVD